MIGTALGLFLVLPNAVSLAIAALTLLLLQVRVGVEEEYLSRAHGPRFAEYCRRTPRWLGMAGRARKN
jgi:protein-S-isoprenylcysteine O-methyltransferase Ste14